jgi:hypothetical protein
MRKSINWVTAVFARWRRQSTLEHWRMAYEGQSPG